MVRRTRYLPLAACALAMAATAFAFPALAGAVSVSPATTAGEAGLVDVRALAPEIDMEMPYAGWHNNTSRQVTGY